MKTILGKHLVQVKTRDTSWNAWITLPDKFTGVLRKSAQFSVNFSRAPSGLQHAPEFIIGCPSDGHLQTVIGQNFKRLDIVDGFSGPNGMDPTGIISDHTAEGAAIMCGRIRAKSKSVGFCRAS